MRGPCLLLLLASSAVAVPRGQTPYLYGMHDEPDRGVFAGDPGCARGWITTLRYIGADGVCGAGDIDYSDWAEDGWGIVMRLDMGGAPALPARPEQYDGFAAAFADCVRRSRGVNVWVVGNEPNLPWGHPEGRPFTPQEYGEIYRRVLAAVDALPDGARHEVLFAAMAPWAALPPWGDWDSGRRSTTRAASTPWRSTPTRATPTTRRRSPATRGSPGARASGTCTSACTVTSPVCSRPAASSTCRSTSRSRETRAIRRATRTTTPTGATSWRCTARSTPGIALIPAS